MEPKNVARALLSAGIISLSLLGCSGGGGGGSAVSPSATPTAATTFSGTVAAGAPMIGTVTVKDSLGAMRTQPIALDGKYSIDVSGMTGPFIFKAVGSVGGRDLALVSAATSADVGGTINITPFTDLIVANIAGMVAEQFFDSRNPNANEVNNTGLKQATDNLTARLTPVLQQLGVSTSLDLLRTSFNADHSGLDKVMDVVKVTVNPDTLQAEIKNIIENTTIVDDLASPSDNTVIVATSTTATEATTVLTALQAIELQLKAFSNLFATSLPQPDNAALQALVVASGFLDGGTDRDTWLNDITTDSSMIGITLKTPVILSTFDNGNKMRVSVAVTAGSEVEQAEFEFWKVNGVWQFAGDQKQAWHDLEPVVSRGPDWSNYQNGLPVGYRFERHLDLWSESGNPNIATIKVEGTGLRTGGLTLIRSTTVGTNHFDIANYTRTGSWLPECPTGITPDTASTSPSDPSGGQCIDFSNVDSTTTYTFTYYDQANQQVGQPTVKKITAKPVAKADAMANFDKWFAKITGVTPSIPGSLGQTTTATNLINGTNIRVAWTAPTDPTFRADYIWINIGGTSLEADGWRATLSSPTLVGTWSGASPVLSEFVHLGASMRDSVGRQYVTMEVTARLP